MSDNHEPFDGDLPPLDPGLSAWLASDPAPAMPDEVWASLEARLAAEPPLVPAGVVDLGRERTKRRGGRVLPVLAGAAGIALVGAVVLPLMRSSDPTPVAEGPTGALAVSSPEGAETRGSDGPLLTDQGLTDQGLTDQGPSPAAAAPGSSQTPEPAPSPTIASVVMPRAMLSSGTDYTADALPAQVTSLLATTGMSDGTAIAEAMSASPTATAMPGSGLASSPEALADCLRRLGLAPDAVPLVLDAATIDGRAGSVIVTVAESVPPGEPTTLHAVAVGQDCTDADVAAARHWDLPLP